MSTSTENADGTAEITFTRDPAKPGTVTIEAVTFGDNGAWGENFGSFELRDLLIALHALTATPTRPTAITVESEPPRRAVSRFFERRKEQ